MTRWLPLLLAARGGGFRGLALAALFGRNSQPMSSQLLLGLLGSRLARGGMFLPLVMVALAARREGRKPSRHEFMHAFAEGLFTPRKNARR